MITFKKSQAFGATRVPASYFPAKILSELSRDHRGNSAITNQHITDFELDIFTTTNYAF
jgi:hypothetical protein